MKHWGCYMKRKTRWLRLTCLCSVVTLGYIYFMHMHSDDVRNQKRLQTVADDPYPNMQLGGSGDDGRYSWRTRHLLTNNNSIYPPDLFTPEQKKNGAIILHCFGMIYMFVALAIVCDEFFVPSLGVIIDRQHISDDVAGATFMAAGGSAPELATSIIGVFFAKSEVGIGTIVGSAVFNILFVIGMCAMFSYGVLHLTWWPLFRDCFFYSISLILLIVFFEDGEIQWWESLLLILTYCFYVLFMKFNSVVESWVKMQLSRTIKSVSPSDQPKRPPSRRQSLPHFRNTNHFRHGALQLMLHTLDPLSDAKTIDEKAVSMHTLVRTSNGNIVPLPLENGHSNNQNGGNALPPPPPSSSPGKEPYTNHTEVPSSRTSSREQIMRSEVTPSAEEHPGNGALRTISCPNMNGDSRTISHPNVLEPGVVEVHRDTVTTQSTTLDSSSPDEIPSVEEIEEPLDLSWPSTLRKQITYLLVAPLVFPMWLTLPDVRRPEKTKWFPITFLGSIGWIACFSYLMVWWADEVGDTIGIHDEVMGLTFLAAGTSIPDLITSVIVARKGLGDMAVSSSIGSNIFDVTIGLPFPWIIWSAIQMGAPITVESKGLYCSIILLFIMLLFVIITIAVCRWKMTKSLGLVMFFMYVVFLTISLLLVFDEITCPF